MPRRRSRPALRAIGAQDWRYVASARRAGAARLSASYDEPIRHEATEALPARSVQRLHSHQRGDLTFLLATGVPPNAQLSAAPLAGLWSGTRAGTHAPYQANCVRPT